MVREGSEVAVVRRASGGNEGRSQAGPGGSTRYRRAPAIWLPVERGDMGERWRMTNDIKITNPLNNNLD